MTHAEEIAAELRAAIQQVHAEVDQIPDERWAGAVTIAEGWPVGHTAHHIGEGYLQSLRWIEQALAEGKPFVLDPQVAVPAVNADNARCLAEHGSLSRAETMAGMEANAQRLVDQVRLLTDAQLDEPMMVIMGQPRPGAQVVLPMAMRHVAVDLESIRGAREPA